MNLHTYHHLCSTLLLSTPYTLSSLPRRAPPAEDGAYILPLPDLNRISGTGSKRGDGGGDDGEEGHSDGDGAEGPASIDKGEGEPRDGEAAPDGRETTKGLLEYAEGGKGKRVENSKICPSLLSPYFRPARKLLVVRREDGYEVRRVWRCGRCGGVVGYEIVGHGQGDGAGAGGVEDGRRDGGLGEGGKVLYLIEGGLVETGSWGGLEEG